MSEHKKPFPFRPEDSALCPIRKDGRHQIAPTVRFIQENGWPNADDLDPRKGAGYEGSEQRVALFASATPVTAEVIAGALNSREGYPPFGLVKRQSYNLELGTYPIETVTGFGDNPFHELRRAFTDTLDLSWNKLHSLYIEHQLPDIQQSYHEAFARLSHYRKGDSEVLIHNGITTGTRSTTNILGAIESVAKRDLPLNHHTPEIYEEIAKGSYPLLKALTRDNGNTCTAVIDELEDNKGVLKYASFNPNHLMIDQKSGLTFTPEFIENFRKKHKTWLGERKAVGCPIMHSSALLNLWNWELEIARAIWAEQLQDPNLLVYTKSGNE